MSVWLLSLSIGAHTPSQMSPVFLHFLHHPSLRGSFTPFTPDYPHPPTPTLYQLGAITISWEQCGTYCCTVSLAPLLPCATYDFCKHVSFTGVCFSPSFCLHTPFSTLFTVRTWWPPVWYPGGFFCLAALCPWRFAGMACWTHLGISYVQWQCLSILPFRASQEGKPSNSLTSASFTPAIPSTPHF